MSDLLNYIRSQKNKGIDDYNILKSARKFMRDDKRSMPSYSKSASFRYNKSHSAHYSEIRGGGYTLDDEQRNDVIDSLNTIDNKDQEGYQEILEAAQNNGPLPDNYQSYDDVVTALNRMVENSGKETQTEEQDKTIETEPTIETTELQNNEDIEKLQDEGLLDVDIQEQGPEIIPPIIPPTGETEEKTVTTYD